MVRQIKKTKARKREKTKKLGNITLFQKIFSFFKDNAKILIYAVSTVIIIGFASSIFFYINKQTERNAAERFYKVLRVYWQNEEAKEENLDGYFKSLRGFSEIVDNYSGTKYGDWSLVYMGNCYLHLKNYQTAIKFYDQYIKKSRQADIFTADAYHGKGIAYIERGKYPEAIKTYMDFLKVNKSPVTEKLLLEIAWCYEKTGDNKKALEYYKKIVKEHPDSLFKSDAERNIKVLEEINQQKS